MTSTYDTNCVEAVVLVALLNDDLEKAHELLSEMYRSELRELRQAFFIGTAEIDQLIKDGHHA